MGIELDRAKNENPGNDDVVISKKKKRVAAVVIAANEELEIARQVAFLAASRKNEM